MTDQNVQYLNPFLAVDEYRKKRWHGTIPVPYGQKHPPISGWTGGKAKGYPTREKTEEWKALGQRNICLRLAGVTKDREIIALDVDAYDDKTGEETLAAWEKELGPLPPTWICTSKTDGVSGHRYYLVPRGLNLKDIGKGIDTIWRGHRYSVVWPSLHPSGDMYWWYPPGVAPTEAGKSAWTATWDGELPDASELPELPTAWLDRMLGSAEGGHADIDLDSSTDEILDWFERTGADVHGEMCAHMEDAVTRRIQEMADDPASHDKLLMGHWQQVCFAMEGHSGFFAGIKKFEDAWVNDVVDRNKRSIDEIRGEHSRSLPGALRKIKKEIDLGKRRIVGECQVDLSAVWEALGPPEPPKNFVNSVPGSFGLRPVPEYERNDDGNALHLIHTFSTLKHGPSFRWVEGKGWIIWTDNGTDHPHWEVDDSDHNSLMRVLWRSVQMRQKAYAEACLGALQTAIQNAIQAAGPGATVVTRGSGQAVDQAIVDARAEFTIWDEFSRKSGNNTAADAAISASKSFVEEKYRVAYEDLDSNPLLLGMTNGVLELDGQNIRLRDAEPGDYVTMSTGNRWEEPSELATRLWSDYLETFLPDPDIRNAAQIILGHCLMGGNPEKIMVVLQGGTNTGKSTMLAVIEKAIGDYAAVINSSALQQSKFNEVLFNAVNSRIALCSEFDEDDQLSSPLIKRITGNVDKIPFSIKYSNASVSAVPQFVVVMATNEAPKISGNDEALRDRLITIPFTTRPDVIDKSAGRVVEDVCATVALRWLVDGYVEYRRLGRLPQLDAIEQATDEFFADLDDVSTFTREVLKSHSLRKSKDVQWQHHKDWVIHVGDLYNRYTAWCHSNKILQKDQLSQPKFTRRIAALGYEKKKMRFNGEIGMHWMGVKIKSFKDQNVTQVGKFQVVQSGD